MKNLHQVLFSLLVGMIIPVGSLLGQSELLDFVNRYFDQRDQFESLTAEVEFRNKLFSKDDTLLTKAFIQMVSQPEDTIFGGYVFVEAEDKTYAYDGETAFFGDRTTSTITINELKENPGGLVQHDWVGNFIEASFLTKNQSGRAAVTNPAFTPTFIDTMIGQWPCKGIHLTLPDQEEFTNFKLLVAYDTIEYMLRFRSISMYFQENEQYQSWTYKHPVFGHHKELTKLNDDFLSSFKHQELYQYIEPDTFGEAIVQKDYSTLQGRIMTSTESFDIKAIEAEVIVLDFWYSSCYPCIKSIPEVNKIYELFSDQDVVVFGVNIIDDELKNKSRIEKYVRNNPMFYQTIMADRSTYEQWVPDGYPMLLILDKNYQLIDRHGGYTEGMADDIAEIIEAHLNN